MRESIPVMLGHHPFVAEFEPRHVEKLATLAKEIRFERDQILFREGDECSEFYLIVTGLVALEWHWALERYGAPQVNSRFEDMSEGRRRMGWQDWSVWMAVKAALTARAKARDPSPQGVEDYMRSNRLRLDGSKGAQMNFRPWDGQMRQPIVLASHNAIIEMAPIEGFLHQSNTLDSLGTDEGEFACN